MCNYIRVLWACLFATPTIHEWSQLVKVAFSPLFLQVLDWGWEVS